MRNKDTADKRGSRGEGKSAEQFREGEGYGKDWFLKIETGVKFE